MKNLKLLASNLACYVTEISFKNDEPKGGNPYFGKTDFTTGFAGSMFLFSIQLLWTCDCRKWDIFL